LASATSDYTTGTGAGKRSGVSITGAGFATLTAPGWDNSLGDYEKIEPFPTNEYFLRMGYGANTLKPHWTSLRTKEPTNQITWPAESDWEDCLSIDGRYVVLEKSQEVTPAMMTIQLRQSRRRERTMWYQRDTSNYRPLLSIDNQLPPRINAKYKKVREKVKPVDAALPEGSVPGGISNWREVVMKEQYARPRQEPVDQFDQYFERRHSLFPRGTRMTQERIKDLRIGTHLTRQEREFAIEMLYRREGALSWTFTEMGRVRPEVAPPQEIRTIPHTPWHVQPFQQPRALQPILIEMLQERIDRGTLEPGHSSYSNPYFLVGKKEGTSYRLINAAQWINKVTIRDSNTPPVAEEFSERYAGSKLITVMDLFSGYDQLPLHENSRDLTTFNTPLGLLRQTTVVMGCTNSVAQFVRVVRTILRRLIARGVDAFVDDIVAGGPFEDYDGEESLPGVRRYVLEHLMLVSETLADLERAGVTVNPLKLDLAVEGAEIVGYYVDGAGRHPSERKVAVIAEWKQPTSIQNARAFIGVCVYYRVWIEGFAIIARPIYALFRQGVKFEWNEECTMAMAKLKHAITTAPALVRLDYTNGCMIYLVVDGSGTGWGCTLEQEDKKGRRHPCRYESGMWSKSERKYDAVKLECRALLHALKKNRIYLWGAVFTIETDARTLIYQLNRQVTDLPGSLVARWIAWIQLWDFQIRHVPGKKNSAADGLSRMHCDETNVPTEPEEDVDEWLSNKLGAVYWGATYPENMNRVREDSTALTTTHVRVTTSGTTTDPEEATSLSGEDSRAGRYGPEDLTDLGDLSDPGLLGEYSREHREAARYLATLSTPEGMHRKERQKFIKHTLTNFILIRQHLFVRGRNGRPHRRILDSEDDQREAVRAIHQEHGHRGVENTMRMLRLRYHWEGMYHQVKEAVKTCVTCQKADRARTREPLYAQSNHRLFGAKWHIDATTVDKGLWMVQCREALSGWPEAKLFTSLTSKKVAAFLFNDIFARFGLPQEIVEDNGSENRGMSDELKVRMGVKGIKISAYNSQAQGFVERGHQDLLMALRKMTDGGRLSVREALPAVLWADRTTVKSRTGHTPAYMVYGQEVVLPVELQLDTWPYLPWQNGMSTSDLIRLRAMQFDRRNVDVEEARARMVRLREEQNERWNRDHEYRMRQEELKAEDLVLLDNTKLRKDFGGKMNFQWRGPYRIVRTPTHGKRSYKIAELDGTVLKGSYHGSRLRLFYVPKGEIVVQDEQPSSMQTGSEMEEEEESSEDEWEDDERQEWREDLGRRKRYQSYVVDASDSEEGIHFERLPPEVRVGEPNGFEASDYQPISESEE
jgi:hypothetical protein